MEKYPMEWLLNIRKSELSSIEMELADISTKIATNIANQEKNNKSILTFQNIMYSSIETWKLSSMVRSIEACELANQNLKNKLEFLNKDKAMILSRYNQKNIEIKMLEKAKANFITKEKAKRAKKQEKMIDELSLIIRKEE